MFKRQQEKVYYHDKFYCNIVSIIRSCETFYDLENCKIFLTYELSHFNIIKLEAIFEFKEQDLRTLTKKKFDELKDTTNHALDVMRYFVFTHLKDYKQIKKGQTISY